MKTPGYFYAQVITICGYGMGNSRSFELWITEPVSEAMYRSIRHHTMAYPEQLVPEEKARFVLRAILWDVRYALRKRLNLQDLH